MLGVSPRTVTRWKNDPTVVAEVDRLRSRTSETRAADVLVRLMDSLDERIALTAAREVLHRKIQRTPEEPPPPDADEVVLPLEQGMRWVASVREEPFE
jgi:hypothetical protein